MGEDPRGRRAHGWRDLFAILLMLAIGFGGVMLTLRELANIPRALASRAWPVAEGVIQSTDFARRRSRVEYTYAVGDRRYSSTRIGFVRGWGPLSGAARRERYRRGAEVEVRYEPASPSVAVLEPGVSPLAVVALVVLTAVFAATLVGGIALARRPGRPLVYERSGDAAWRDAATEAHRIDLEARLNPVDPRTTGRTMWGKGECESRASGDIELDVVIRNCPLPPGTVLSVLVNEAVIGTTVVESDRVRFEIRGREIPALRNAVVGDVVEIRAGENPLLRGRFEPD